MDEDDHNRYMAMLRGRLKYAKPSERVQLDATYNRIKVARMKRKGISFGTGLEPVFGQGSRSKALVDFPREQWASLIFGIAREYKADEVDLTQERMSLEKLKAYIKTVQRRVKKDRPDSDAAKVAGVLLQDLENYLSKRYDEVIKTIVSIVAVAKLNCS